MIERLDMVKAKAQQHKILKESCRLDLALASMASGVRGA